MAGQPATAGLHAWLQSRLLADWDPNQIDARIRASQRRRLFLRELGLRHGAFPSWSHEARPGDKTRFVRPATAGRPVGPKPRARFPFVVPTPPHKTG